MKAEYTNLFKFAVNQAADEVQIVFELTQPVIEREPGNPDTITTTGTTSAEVSALVMNIKCARSLANELNRLLPPEEGA